MDILFSHVTCATMDEAMHVYPDAFVGVQDGRISYLSTTAPKEQPQKIIDGTGLVLLPGLTNIHTHMPMTLLRGYADDYPLAVWLNDHIFPREDRLDDRVVRAGTLLSLAEFLRFGVTSVSDSYFYCDAMSQAVAESGIKANISRSISLFEDELDFETYRPCQEMVALKEKWHNYDNGRIRIEASIHAEYTSNYHLWDALAEYAINEGIGMQIHLSETRAEHEACKEKYGLTPTQLLDCHNVFLPRTTAAHCVWLEPEDMQLLAKRGVTAAHCPVSNLKLGSGIAKVRELVASGMNVALGTDGMASNNNGDLFEEIKMAALLAKGISEDPTAVTAEAALMMATVCGAKAQGREAECGMIKIGMDADLILLDFTGPHLIPCHNVLSHLAYSASGHDVVLTMVRGQILYANGEFPTIDMKAVMKELGDYAMPQMFLDEKD